MRSFATLLAAFFAVVLSGVSANALQLRLSQALRLRDGSHGQALNYDSAGHEYVLPRGSVIEIPDSVVVRNDDGTPNLQETLAKWLKNPKAGGAEDVAGKYQIKNRGEDAGARDDFFPIRVISTPDGKVPPGAKGLVALGFAEHSQALKVQAVEAVLPMPRPNSEKPVVETAPVPEKYTAPPPAYDDSPPGPLKVVVHGANPLPEDAAPVPLPPIDRKAEEAINAVNAANAAIQHNSSSPPCPTCEIYHAGDEESETRACHIILGSGFPNDLDTIARNDDQELGDLMDWMANAKPDLEACTASCPIPEAKSGILNQLQYNLEIGRWTDHLKTACVHSEQCQAACNTRAMVHATASSKSCGRHCTCQARENSCIKGCSPFGNVNVTKRKQDLYLRFYQVQNDLAKANPKLAKGMGSADQEARRMVCLNAVRENVDFEPMDGTCTSTAVGLGQVLDATFYETLGLTGAMLKRCHNIPIGELHSKCKGWDAGAALGTARMDIYGHNYDDITVDQLYQRRTYDIEVQVRSAYATFTNKMRYAGFGVNSALRGYYGFSDKNATARIEKCMAGWRLK